jgi:uncharacterized protein
MKINNITKNVVLAQEAIVASKLWQRVKGLLGQKELKPGSGLVLKPCNSVHTFFMLFSIDVLFLDKANRVIKAVSGLKPFRLTPLYFNAYITIELPVGVIQASKTAQGDILCIE